MEIHEKIEQLTKQGFTLNTDGTIMIKDLPKENDRFDTVLYVYLADIDTVYINVYKLSGLQTISDGDLLRNHNECQSTAKAHYVKIMAALPFLSSAVKDTEPSESLTPCDVTPIPFAIDPLFITMQLLRHKYNDVVSDRDIAESTRNALNHVLYINPLTDDELTAIWEKWLTLYPSETDDDSIHITGEQSQIDQLFEIMCQTDRYTTQKKLNYLRGIDYDYAVIDLKAEDVVESAFGNHYLDIINLINKHHSDTFYDLTQEEKDAFILSNFNLVGSKYDNKQYYVDSVNESIQWYECRPDYNE